MTDLLCMMGIIFILFCFHTVVICSDLNFKLSADMHMLFWAVSVC